ncbi:MAG: ABC transporter ATP-binding protein [archaeon]
MKRLLEVNIKRKQFGKNNLVIRNLAFIIEKNKFTTIIGPSGCGKSTLLKAIVGLDQDYEGLIKLNGRGINSPTKECGIIFQEPRLMPWMSVKENISFGLEKNNKNIVYELLELLELGDFSGNFPHQLSGGMAQKAALARALVNMPNLLLLDEPFGSLDAITRHKLQRKLLELIEKENSTALLVTHDLDEAVYLSDEILIMSQRPARIIKQYEINLPKPRDRADKRFSDMVAKIYKYLEKDLIEI